MVAAQIAIAFHGIGTPSRDMEPGEQRYWISQDRFLRFLDLVAADRDPARMLLTFDDGNASDFEIALAALQERGLIGSFFVITSRLDRIGSLSSAQVRELSAAGMSIGSHGINHVDWRKLDPQGLETELVGSKRVLESCLGRAVTSASVPFGRYNAGVLSALQSAGYDRVYSTDGGPSRPADRLVSRTNVRAETTLRDFADLVQGHETLKGRIGRKLKALRRKFT